MNKVLTFTDVAEIKNNEGYFHQEANRQERRRGISNRNLSRQVVPDKVVDGKLVKGKSLFHTKKSNLPYQYLGIKKRGEVNN